MPPKNYSKVEVPPFLNIMHECNDPRFFIACYYLTMFLRCLTPFSTLLSLEELKKLVDTKRESIPIQYRNPFDVYHRRFFFIIKKYDPTLYCWYNFYTLLIIPGGWNSHDKKVVFIAFYPVKQVHFG